MKSKRHELCSHCHEQQIVNRRHTRGPHILTCPQLSAKLPALWGPVWHRQLESPGQFHPRDWKQSPCLWESNFGKLSSGLPYGSSPDTTHWRGASRTTMLHAAVLMQGSARGLRQADVSRASNRNLGSGLSNMVDMATAKSHLKRGT